MQSNALEMLQMFPQFLLVQPNFLCYMFGSLDIAPTRDCTRFRKIGFVAGFIPIISTKVINQIKKENLKKKVKFYAYKI